MKKKTKEMVEDYSPDEMVDAKRMTIGKYSDKRGWPVPFGHDDNDDGYQVAFRDGFVTWITKDHYVSLFPNGELVT